MSQFMLLIRGGSDTSNNLSPEQIQAAIERYRTWAQKLRSQGRLIGAEKLKDNQGMLLTAKYGQVTVDGQFAETKETIGGYFIIKAADMHEAIEISKECAAFSEGGAVELREIES